MMKNKRFLWGVLVFIISLPIFIFLDNGFSYPDKSRFTQELVFSLALSLTFSGIFRKYILILSVICFMIMIFFVIFLKFNIANWFGSLGFGVLLIYFIGLLSQLIKRGYTGES